MIRLRIELLLLLLLLLAPWPPLQAIHQATSGRSQAAAPCSCPQGGAQGSC